MRKGLVLATLAFVLLMAVGCKDSGKDVTGKAGAPISLKVTGASGKALSEGTVVGVIAGSPVGSDNISCRVGVNGLLSSDCDFNWGYKQSENTAFLAYLPYNPDYSCQETAVFSIPADQSTGEGFAAADLQLGMVSGNPQTRGLSIRLKHLMCALQVTFDNRTSDEIRSVEVTGFILSGNLDLLTGAFAADGGSRPITPFRSPGGDDTFCFLFAPQSTTPHYTVTMKSGKQYAFTYSKPVNPYPGSLIYKSDIVISEETPSVNILEDSKTGLANWNEDGMPGFPTPYTRVDLAHLKDVKTDAGGHFGVSLKPVTVTHTDKYEGSPMGVVLEDGSRAMYVWLKEGESLEVGRRLSGYVQGNMLAASDYDLRVTGLSVKEATVSENKVELPLTECTFRSLRGGIDTLVYRRMLFHDVTMVSGFDGDLAMFSQDGETVHVVCPGNAAPHMDAGISGDIIGFPAVQGNSFVVMAYDESCFSNLIEADYTGPFANIQEYGAYDISNPDMPQAIMADTGDIQTSFHRANGSLTSVQFADYENNMALFVYMDEKLFVNGHYVKIVLLTNGEFGVRHGDCQVKCVKVSVDRVWLIDTENNIGFIMPLEL